MVVAGDDAAVLAGVDDVRVGRVGDDVAGLAAADGVPVAERGCRRLRAVARARRGAEVLHACRRRGTGTRLSTDDVVELADRQRRRVPGLAAVGA